MLRADAATKADLRADRRARRHGRRRRRARRRRRTATGVGRARRPRPPAKLVAQQPKGEGDGRRVYLAVLDQAEETLRRVRAEGGVTLVLDESQRAALRLVVASRLGIVTSGRVRETTSLAPRRSTSSTACRGRGRTVTALRRRRATGARHRMGRPAASSTACSRGAWAAATASRATRRTARDGRGDRRRSVDARRRARDRARRRDRPDARASSSSATSTSCRHVGVPFRDLIASKRIPVARLTTLHRCAAGVVGVRKAPAVLADAMRPPLLAPDFAFARAAVRRARASGGPRHVRRIARSDEPLEVECSRRSSGAAGTAR